MSEILCPICQRPNDPNAERCWYCQAVLPQENKPADDGAIDWLSGLRDESAQSPEPATPEPSPEETEQKEDEIPDWLARIRAREQTEREDRVEVPIEDKPEEKKEELPDWLKQIKAGNSAKPDEVGQTRGTEGSAEIPDLRNSGTEPDQTAADKDDDESANEWLNRLAAWNPEKNGPIEAVEDIEPSQEAEDQTPHLQLHSVSRSNELLQQKNELDRSTGWQKLIPAEPESASLLPTRDKSSEGQFEGSPVDSENPENNLPTEPTESVFDIDSLRGELDSGLTTLDDATELSDAQIDHTENDELLSETSITDRLSELEIPLDENKKDIDSEPALKVEIPSSAPFLQDDLPDWLESASIEKLGKKISEGITEELDSSSLESNLEKANLPSWLRAIRPSSSEIFTDSEITSPQNTQDKGLLAGISGTLQSPEITGDFRKPVGYGSALKVSERQKSNANLLASLMEETLDHQETLSSPKGSKKGILWRLLLAAVMIGVIFFARDFLTNFTIQPALFPPEVVAVYDVVNSLPTDKPILLVGDFEPAVTGELTWSSQTLLEHLMHRNLNIAILSTNPTGTTILFQQLAAVGLNIPGYDFSTRLIDLGYLPGGSTGLQLMTKNLRSAKTDTVNFQDPWNSSVLQSVNTLQDFGAMIVFSDKTESAQIWIEQIQPAIPSMPLIFVISAQAAPMLQPYYQSGQVSGFIAGFNGNIAYEKIFQQSTAPSQYLGAFQFSILFAALILLIGGLIHLMRPAVIEQKR